MTTSALSHVTFGYRPLWNRCREISGVQLFIDSDKVQPVDTRHLLRTLAEIWTPHAPTLLLSPQSRPLLHGLLAHATDRSVWIEVRNNLLEDMATVEAVINAHLRGMTLVWRGSSAVLPDPELASCFRHCLFTLSPEDAVLAAGACTLWSAAQLPPHRMLETDSPVMPHQLYEDLASRTLMHHCLDQRRAMGLVGWPSDDVLHGWQHRAMQPERGVITTLLRVIEADESLEVIEHIMSRDPVLVYRFLAHANSPALGLQAGIDSLRRALMMVGYSNLRRWLHHQFPNGQDDIDLRPIKGAMVLRARLMENLLEAGEEDELRREVYLCGLFSQMDTLLGVPLGTTVQTLPLSERIHQATVLNDGPYEPCLSLARALEQEDGSAVLQLCERDELELDLVNRALLRTLSAIYVRPDNGPRGERRRRSRGRKLGK